MLYIDKQSFPISKKYRKNVFHRFLFLDGVKEPLEKRRETSGKEEDTLENYIVQKKK